MEFGRQFGFVETGSGRIVKQANTFTNTLVYSLVAIGGFLFIGLFHGYPAVSLEISRIGKVAFSG